MNLLHNNQTNDIICSICKTETKVDEVKNLIKNMALVEIPLNKNLYIFSEIKVNEIEDNSSHNNKLGNNFQKQYNHLTINNAEVYEGCIYRSSTPNINECKAFGNTRRANNKSISQFLNFGNADLKNLTTSNICSLHGKRIEAFCDQDKMLLCVSCILENDHKNHDLLATDKAAQVQKDIIKTNIIKINEKESKIKDEINLIENHLKNYKYDSDEKLKKIEDFFKIIYFLLSIRKEYLKSKIVNHFDSETEKVLIYRKILEDKLKLIEQIKQEKTNFSKMNDLEILTLTKDIIRPSRKNR